MPELHGNLEGIKKATLTDIKALYDETIPAEKFIPYELLEKLCGFSSSVNREIALYISRYGDILDVIIGKSDRIDLPELRLRRSTARLSMVRCVHTHPKDGGELSDVDISALVTVQLDAMCAVGVSPGGTPTTVQCAFLDPFTPGGTTVTDVLPAKSLPDAQWLRQIEEVDSRFRATLPASQPDREKAVLVGIESGDSLSELALLAETAGAEALECILQKRDKPDPSYCVGKGKAEELALTVQSVQANLVIFDEELTGVMQRNLEELLQVKVVDRTALILDIFALRAKTSEGKLQVEMAQLKYRSQRLLGQGLALSRLAGGIGTRGPGENKLEVGRRRIRERMTDLERQLCALEKQRSLRRKRREKNRIPIVALVGYTNAGKSTLLNTLTQSKALAEDKLFATLDPFSKRLRFPQDQEIILTDTVGFIRDLPPALMDAFAATLEEIRDASLILHLIDASNPHCEKHIQIVEQILHKLGSSDIPQIKVFNKMDNVDQQILFELIQRHDGIGISALQRKTLGPLIEYMQECLKN